MSVCIQEAGCWLRRTPWARSRRQLYADGYSFQNRSRGEIIATLGRNRRPCVTAIYCASVSPGVRCVSTIVRRTPASVSDNVRRKWPSIARRAVHYCAPLHLSGRWQLQRWDGKIRDRLGGLIEGAAACEEPPFPAADAKEGSQAGWFHFRSGSNGNTVCLPGPHMAFLGLSMLHSPYGHGCDLS